MEVTQNGMTCALQSKAGDIERNCGGFYMPASAGMNQVAAEAADFFVKA